MTGALVILAFMVVVGIVLYAIDMLYYRKRGSFSAELPDDSVGVGGVVSSGDGVQADDGEECCGMHLVCEKKETYLSTDVVYYDDEELDRFRGRDAGSYEPEEVDEFRDVLLTLLPQDVAGWARSLDLREIRLPSELRDELMMMMEE